MSPPSRIGQGAAPCPPHPRPLRKPRLVAAVTHGAQLPAASAHRLGPWGEAGGDQGGRKQGTKLGLDGEKPSWHRCLARAKLSAQGLASRSEGMGGSTSGQGKLHIWSPERTPGVATDV